MNMGSIRKLSRGSRNFRSNIPVKVFFVGLP
jgi:hypothetical protein